MNTYFQVRVFKLPIFIMAISYVTESIIITDWIRVNYTDVLVGQSTFIFRCVRIFFEMAEHRLNPLLPTKEKSCKIKKSNSSLRLQCTVK